MATDPILPAIAPAVVLLASGVVALVVSRWLRLSPIIGYLVLGAVLHGTGLSMMRGPTVQVLAELGLVFLLFDIGLHFSIAHVREQARSIFGLGPVQVLLGTFAFGSIGVLMGPQVLPALLVGATIGLSSTAVVEPIIMQRGQQNCPVGLTATAILIYQDIAALFILVVAEALGSGRALLPQAMLALLKAMAAVAVAIVLARAAVRPFLDLIARSRNEEVFPAAALLIALAAGWATGAVGLPLSLGAFLGGMVIAETPYRPIVRSEIRPFRGLLLGFFFVYVGASLDIGMILEAWPVVIGLAATMVAIKIAMNAAASLIFRWSIPGAIQLGFLLAQGSEIAFVILGLPQVRAAIGEDVSALLIAAVTLTIAVTPNLATAGRALAARLRRVRSLSAEHELVERGRSAPVFIAGMGKRGRAVADALDEFGITHAAIDHDQRRLGGAVADGYDVAYGQIGDTRLWETLAMTGRRLLVITEPDYESSRELTPLARQFFPDVIRLVAVGSEHEAARFAAIGLETVVEREDGEDLAKRVLTLLDVDEAAIAAWRDRRHARASEVSTSAQPFEVRAALAGARGHGPRKESSKLESEPA